MLGKVDVGGNSERDNTVNRETKVDDIGKRVLENEKAAILWLGVVISP